MERPWFRCEPVGEEFLAAAPVRLVGRFEVPLPAPRVWEELCADDTLHWCRILSDVSWTSPRPFGVGTTRVATALGGAAVLRESFFRWEEGRRFSFHVVEASAPLCRSFAEDYLVEPRGENACRFTWTIALEPRGAGWLGAPALRRILATLFADTAAHYGLR